MDKFFMKTKCDRCGKILTAKTMSMFNEDCLCLECKEKEKNLPNYKKALNKDIEEIKKGYFNFKGIGLKKTKKEVKHNDINS